MVFAAVAGVAMALIFAYFTVRLKSDQTVVGTAINILSLGLTTTLNRIAGGGFMALAAVVFGNYTPSGVLIASLIFGAGDAVKYKLQAGNTGIPTRILAMIPYLIALISICMIRHKSNKPAASAVPYVKE